MPECGHARATPVRADDSALLHVLEAYIETLKAENEILKRQLADAEARAERLMVQGGRTRAVPVVVSPFPIGAGPGGRLQE